MLIVIPAHNEEETIQDVIHDLHLHGYKDIVVVDDASTDKTAILAKEAGAKVLNMPYNLGAWKATQTGVRYACDNNYSHLVTFDADKQHLASQIKNLIENQAMTGSNLVIGSCPSRGSLSRRAAWKFFRKLSGVKVNDLTSGFRLYDKYAISVLSQEEASLIEYQDVGVLLMLKTFNIEKSEVSVEMHRRESGISRIFHSWWAVLYYMAYTTMLCLSKIAKRTHFLSDNIKEV